MAYYDFVRIYGLADSDTETFQGLGAAALYNARTSQPVSGGEEGSGTGGGGVPSVGTQESLAAVWGIQNEWIDAEIARLESYIGTLEYAQTMQLPEMADDGTRGIWAKVIQKIAQYAGYAIPYVGQAAAVLGIVADTIAVVEFAHDLYKRFWVGRETLRNLPLALIELCKMTIDLLRKVRDLPQTQENFQARMLLTTQLTERFEQQLQYYLTIDTGALTSTLEATMEQLTQSLDTLAFQDEEIDFGGVRVSLRSKVIAEP